MVARPAVMTEVRCQEVDWQKAAIIVMARGDSEAGMRADAMHDRLERSPAPRPHRSERSRHGASCDRPMVRTC